MKLNKNGNIVEIKTREELLVFALVYRGISFSFFFLVPIPFIAEMGTLLFSILLSQRGRKFAPDTPRVALTLCLLR